jgi:hypothetical protein
MFYMDRSIGRAAKPTLDAVYVGESPFYACVNGVLECRRGIVWTLMLVMAKIAKVKNFPGRCRAGRDRRGRAWLWTLSLDISQYSHRKKGRAVGDDGLLGP